MTNVLDFLPDPVTALCHTRESLSSNGLLFVSIRNRMAYWPLYHLCKLARVFEHYPRLKHWFLWFTTPLAMRRNDQPFERVYSPAEASELLAQAGLKLVARAGMMWLPMLWIPNLTSLIKVMKWVDKLGRLVPGYNRFYYYMFICQIDAQLT